MPLTLGWQLLFWNLSSSSGGTLGPSQALWHPTPKSEQHSHKIKREQKHRLHLYLRCPALGLALSLCVFGHQEQTAQAGKVLFCFVWLATLGMHVLALGTAARTFPNVYRVAQGYGEGQILWSECKRLSAKCHKGNTRAQSCDTSSSFVSQRSQSLCTLSLIFIKP